MSQNLVLDPVKLAEAQIAIETVFGPKYIETLQERSSVIVGLGDSSYKEDIIKAERANEANYNLMLDPVRAVRDSITGIEGVAKALAAREAAITKEMSVDTKIEAIETAGLINM